VRLISRYLLRQLAAPFLFALGALTSLMLLSQVAKKFGALVGKGLPWGVIGEVFALSLPFIVAMTLPMAVLLAVLYAFSHLAADNEITAMRASGISVYQILAPVLAWGVFMSAFNFAFVDQVLPRSNARLRGLLIDIGRKKPTFELREQVINEVPPSQYFLRAGRIDAATGRLKDITIYDLGGESSRRIIYADSGQMAYGEGQTDLNLRLYDGAIHQYRPSDPLSFQLTYYRVNNIRVKDVYDELVRNSSETVRGDREMSTCEMLSVIRDARSDQRSAAHDRDELLREDLRGLLRLPALRAPAPAQPDAQPPVYCRWIDKVQAAAALTKTDEPPIATQRPKSDLARQGATVPLPAPGSWPPQQVRAEVDSPPVGARNAQVPLKSVHGKPLPGMTVPGKPLLGKPLVGKPLPGELRPGKPLPGKPVLRKPVPGKPGPGNPVGNPVPERGAQGVSAAGQARAVPPGAPGSPPPLNYPKPRENGLQLSNWAQVATAADRAQDADRRADRFLVEVHKKWAISMACISFVIVGIVLALRFPRGGIGLVIGGGLLVFSIHYIGLTAGESLADRGLVSPWVAMWTPNIALTIVGLLGLLRVSRESGSTRGGDFQEVLDAVRHIFRRLRRLVSPETPGEAA
jgi:lipopolysaccharide export system permease protein